MGCHFLPQGIFPTQGLKLCFLHAPALAGKFFTTWAISPFLKLKLADGLCILLCFSNNLLLDLLLWLCLVTQSCSTLCNTMDCSPPGSSVHGVLQARLLEWVAISLSRGSSRPRDWTHVSCSGRCILYHWATREILSEEQGQGIFYINTFWPQWMDASFIRWRNLRDNNITYGGNANLYKATNRVFSPVLKR